MARRLQRACMAALVAVGAIALKPQDSSANDGTGSITGVVTDEVSGALVDRIGIAVFDAQLRYVGSDYTAIDGTFRVDDLPASTLGYAVCVVGTHDPLATSSTGYPGECWLDGAWNGDTRSPSSEARRVPVAVDSVTRVDFAIAPAGAIAGQVTESGSGLALADAHVEVQDLHGNPFGSARTDANGAYSIAGLPAQPLRVCVYQDLPGTSRFGLSDICYRDVPVEGTWDDPTGFTPVVLPPGGVHTDVDLAPAARGVVSGTIRDSRARGIDSIGVSAYAADRDLVGSVLTDRDGEWQLALAPSRVGYTICVDPGASRTGYVPRCTGGAPWDGNYLDPPTGAQRIPVRSNRWHRHVDLAVRTGGAISGTLRSAETGAPISQGLVTIYTPDGDVVRANGGPTGTDGTYDVSGLPPSKTGYVVCFDARHNAPREAASYVAQCYPDVPRPGTALPAGTVPVPVRAGRTATGIGGRIAGAAALSGYVTSSAGGLQANVRVSAFDPIDHTLVEQEKTYHLRGGPFRYLITDLPPSSAGYVLCFDGADAVYGGLAGGASAKCYPNKPWDGRAADIPADAEPVAVPTGGHRDGQINAVLNPRGRLSGMVSASGRTLQNVAVSVFDAHGAQLGDVATTTGSGAYAIGGLVDGDYTVCFDARHAVGSDPRYRLRSACTGDVAWTPGTAPPPSASTVPAVIGTDHGGVDVEIRSFRVRN